MERTGEFEQTGPLMHTCIPGRDDDSPSTRLSYCTYMEAFNEKALRRFLPTKVIAVLLIPLFLSISTFFSDYRGVSNEYTAASNGSVFLQNNIRLKNETKAQVQKETNTPVSVRTCVWSPQNNTPCVELFRELQESGNFTNNRRWIFFGDSTMSQMYGTNVKKNVHKQFRSNAEQWKRKNIGTCKQHELQGSGKSPVCNIHSLLNYTPAVNWTPPAVHEGPRTSVPPFCMACGSCKPRYFNCSFHGEEDSRIALQQTLPAFGGFFGIEYAKDVESPSTLYATTQETIAHHLSTSWNSPFQMKLFGKPVCVVSAGIHDAGLDMITDGMYEKNIQFYLSVLQPQCERTIWITNTVPDTDERAQKRNRTRVWNQYPRKYLWPNQSMVVDVYNASLHEPHKDNIHMTSQWYTSLANTILQMIGS